MKYFIKVITYKFNLSNKFECNEIMELAQT